MSKETKEVQPELRQSKTEKLFYLAKDKNNKIAIIVGNYRVCEKSFSNYDEAERYIETKPYELIFTTMSVITRNILKDYENEKTKLHK